MEKENRTIDTMMSWFHQAVQEKKVISPGKWIEAAQYANVLIGDEHDKLFDISQLVAQDKAKLISEGNSVAKAQALVEGTQEYKEYRKQKAKISQIEEFIRISKIQARLKDEEMRNY